jgi:hypothetical protein
MKKLLLMLLAAAFVGTLSSCSKDDDGPSTVFTAEIDGDEFEVDDIFGYVDGDDVWVYGVDDDDNSIDIYFTTDDVEEGDTYDVEDGDVTMIYYGEDGDEAYWAASGELDVTKLSETRFEATFEFEGDDFSGNTVDVTDGVVKTPLEDF